MRYAIEEFTVYEFAVDNIQPLPSLSKRKGLTNLLEFIAEISLNHFR